MMGSRKLDNVYYRCCALVLVAILLVSCGGKGINEPTVSSAPTAVPPTPTATRPVSTDTPLLVKTPGLTPTDTTAPSGQVTLDAVGDIMLGRTVGQQVLAKGPQIVFAGVQSALDAADVRVGNLECALTDQGTPAHKQYTLQAPPAAAKALSLGKFDVVSVANNHAMDYGYVGLADAQKNLSQAGVATVGAGANFAQAHSPVIFQRNGLRLAFLAYVDVPVEKDGFDTRTWVATATQPGIAWADPEQITADVSAAKRQADLVIVLLHSGYEIGTYLPSISNNQHVEAHAAIDAGAALVLGAHPHVLQSIEHYHGGLIVYSLGNFVFDDYQGVADATVILRVKLTRAGVQSYDTIPVLIEDGLPHVITPDLAPAIGTLIAPVTPGSP